MLVAREWSSQLPPANQTVNRTPKAYSFWFPPLRSGAGYLSVNGKGFGLFGWLCATGLGAGLGSQARNFVSTKAFGVGVRSGCFNRQRRW